MVEVTVVDYGVLVTAALFLTQILKGLGPLKGIEPQHLAVAVAEGMALLAVLGGQMPISGLMEIAKLVATAGIAGATAVGMHTVVVKPLEPAKPTNLEPAVLPTDAPIPQLPGEKAAVVNIFFRDANSMNPSEGIWKTFVPLLMPSAVASDFRLRGTKPVFALALGSGIRNPPVETKEHGVITQILTSVKADDGSRVDVFCK